MAAKRMRRVALALGLAWACWWVFFATAEAFASHQFGGAIAFLVVMPGTVALAWKWPAIGGVLFLVEGTAAIGMYTPMWLRRFSPLQTVALFAMMPLPPLAAGILLLLARKARHPAAA